MSLHTIYNRYSFVLNLKPVQYIIRQNYVYLHNFTIYNLENKDVHCYWFYECTAGLVASAYTTCIIDCLKKTLSKKLLPIIIYSDGCTVQNRNAVLSNALLELAMDYNIQVEQKILEKGHTQMEVDSCHSAIECQIKHRDIYLPSLRSTHQFQRKLVLCSPTIFYDGLPHK
ncbi:hypothetical protein ACJJTC_007889 [Scirpophaga incertulas]